MTEYKEQPISGKQWTRGCRVVIDNPRKSIPTVTVFEETVYIVGENQEITSPCGSFAMDFDPAEEFQLYDPATNEKIEGQTFYGGELYQMIYSYYLHNALKRDNKE